MVILYTLHFILLDLNSLDIIILRLMYVVSNGQSYEPESPAPLLALVTLLRIQFCSVSGIFFLERELKHKYNVTNTQPMSGGRTVGSLETSSQKTSCHL